MVRNKRILAVLNSICSHCFMCSWRGRGGAEPTDHENREGMLWILLESCPALFEMVTSDSRTFETDIF